MRAANPLYGTATNASFRSSAELCGMNFFSKACSNSRLRLRLPFRGLRWPDHDRLHQMISQRLCFTMRTIATWERESYVCLKHSLGDRAGKLCMLLVNIETPKETSCLDRKTT